MPGSDDATPPRAIILAAGMGTRLRSVADNVPKGLLALDGEPIVGRSVRLLRSAGIAQVTIVAGHLAEQYRAFAEKESGVEIVTNDAFATSGSMASLSVALDRAQEDVVVLESDLVYEPRALTAILKAPARDATLLSEPTGAGDEVWVYAPEGRVHAMSKSVEELPGVTGEFVGITRLSAAAATAMFHAFVRFVETHDHARMDYETDALVALSRLFPIAAVLVPDLCWGEIDDERHFARVVQQVWPALHQRAANRSVRG